MKKKPVMCRRLRGEALIVCKNVSIEENGEEWRVGTRKSARELRSEEKKDKKKQPKK